ncbi:hypothetical protein NDU88_003183 [Pleurodeles waltl]|uniref:Uncharacterized protein n=1 Tax=Pleurodeles waltl TaxID=8319 RepID=A0AAV7LM85_PLEWA|nr:hypothetical protein NDU88_003183 [Pleurodeles waltl]
MQPALRPDRVSARSEAPPPAVKVAHGSWRAPMASAAPGKCRTAQRLSSTPQAPPPASPPQALRSVTQPTGAFARAEVFGAAQVVPGQQGDMRSTDINRGSLM